MACLQKIIDLEEKTMLKFDTLKNDYPSRKRHGLHEPAAGGTGGA